VFLLKIFCEVYSLVQSSYEFAHKVIIFVKTKKFTPENIKTAVELELNKYSGFSEVVVINEKTGEMITFVRH
jgi:hypothetical protein